MDNMISLKRVAAQHYETKDGLFQVVKQEDGYWFWFSSDGKHNGESRTTKTESVGDLAEFFRENTTERVTAALIELHDLQGAN